MAANHICIVPYTLVLLELLNCMNFKITQVILTAIKLPDIAKNTPVLFLDRTPKFNIKKCLITPRFYTINSILSNLYRSLHVLWTFMFLTATAGTGLKIMKACVRIQSYVFFRQKH